MHKPRSDSKLLNLPEEQQAQLAEWLLSGLPYHKAKALIEKEFGITTSLAALSAFWDDVCSQALSARRQQAVTTADEIADEARKNPGQFDAAMIDAIKQKALAISISPQAKPGEVKSLLMILLKSRDQELKSKDIEIKIRRLELLEKQTQKARDLLADGTLSEDERERKMKENFGL
jgi:hypothetical protein